MTKTSQEEFWSDYYGDVVRGGAAWLDYSNERVQAQTFGLALDAAGPLRGRRCLDIGCGWGHFSCALAAFGATGVVGVDIVPEMIAHHQEKYPHIRWLCSGVSTLQRDHALGSFDIVFLLEVLQYVPFPEGLRSVWDQVLPGGRIVAVLPNASCPIVSRTRSRLGENYAPPTIGELHSETKRWGDLDQVAFRPLSFSTDQRVAPYTVSEWQAAGGWQDEPNRIQFVATKRSVQAD